MSPLTDPHLTFKRRGPILRAIRKQLSCNETIRPIRTDHELRAKSSLPRDDLYAIGGLCDPLDTGTGPDISPCANRLLNQIMIETISHDHVCDGLGRLDDQRVPSSMNKLHALDSLFHDRPKPRLQ